jgi:phospholipid/cholesterol/gamma-HCH transport system permease protein
MMAIVESIASLGQACIRFVHGLGNFAMLLAKILVRTVPIWRRPRLIGAQVHFLGNHSLAIIL